MSALCFNKKAQACRVLASELTPRHESEVLLRRAKACDDLSGTRNPTQAKACWPA